MSVVGLIPARGGSKRIPGKNLVACAGQPLLAWTAEAALGAKRLDHVLLSTDDPDIEDAGRRMGLDVPFRRPAELSGDEVPMLPVVQHARRFVEEARGEPVEAMVLLQPTSPLRQASDIDAAVDLLKSTLADTVVSVVRVPHQFHPLKVLHVRDGGLRPYCQTAPPQGMSRGPLPDAYGRNGPAILATRASVLDRGSLYGDPCLPYEMEPGCSIDIDEPLDLALAEFLLLRRRAARKAQS